MRRALAFGLLAAVLLLLPTAAGIGLPLLGKKKAEQPPPPEPETAPTPFPDPIDLPDPVPRGAALAPPSAGPSAAAHRLAPAAALGGLAALALLAALGLARWASRPRHRKTRKRSFEAGREEGWSAQATSVGDALAALRGPLPVGTVKSAREDHGEFVVGIERRKREPCAFAQGYLTGLFESAFASDVRIRHEACAGKARGAVCWYAISRSAGPAGAASIPGSAGAPRRWPQAPAGRAAAGPRAPRSGSP